MRHSSLFLLLLPFAAIAQDTPAPRPTAPAAAQAPAPAPSPSAKPVVPDYPDQRTLTFGAFYWFTGPGTKFDVRSGKLAGRFNEALPDLGKAHYTPAIELSMPVTRTGSLYLEVFRTQGTGNQTATEATTVFASDFSKADYLATNYRITSGKLFLDDLFFPHKFPVAKFRVKSLIGVEYVGMHASVDSITGSQNISVGNRTILLPSIGFAAEYALAAHVLLRAAGSGFGLPHRSLIYDAEATISVRQGRLEFVGGAKVFHVKSSPSKEEYLTADLYGGFAGLRYHFGSK